MAFRKDLTGIRVGQLVITGFSHNHVRGRNSHSMWFAKCDCGGEKVLRGVNFTKGLSTSCGCSRRGHRTPNKGHALYKVWLSMRNRCNNPNADNYYRYGRRGIKVCERWGNFEMFFSDVIEGYKKGLQLDRINNDGDYEPTNIRWVTHTDNMRNSTVSKLNIDIVKEIRDSKETNIYWANKLNMNVSHISDIRTYKSWKNI